METRASGPPPAPQQAPASDLPPDRPSGGERDRNGNPEHRQERKRRREREQKRGRERERKRVGSGLPVRPATGRVLVLAGVFVCAACGLVYELQLVALASYLVGDSVTQTSVVLSLMVFAMGAGSLAAKRLRPRAALGFGAVEAVLALTGGGSCVVLYAAFAWLGGGRGPAAHATSVLLVVVPLLIGLLIGAEVPLLMVLIQRVRRQDPGGAVADLSAADYVGALVGGLAFPFLLLPQFGQLTGALLTGVVNAVTGAALVLGLFRGDLTGRTRRLLALAYVCVLAVLVATAALAGDFERAGRRAVYGAEARTPDRTDRPDRTGFGDALDVVLTGGPGHHGPLMVNVGGQLWLRGTDEPRYHRALLAPAATGPHPHVLILGGGDGLAAHEALRRRGTTRVDVVAPAATLPAAARTDQALAALNGHAFRDPRVHLTVTDPLRSLRTLQRHHELVVADLPAPTGTASSRYYSEEFYGLAARALAPGGRLVVRACGPGAADAAQAPAFWTIDATLRAAGLRTLPYTLGTWSFLLAAADHAPALPPGAHDLTRLRPTATAASTLLHPRYGTECGDPQH